MKKYIKIKHPPIGMYISDANTLSSNGKTSPPHWLCDVSMPYLPVLNILTVSRGVDVRLTTGESISDDIVSYNHTEQTCNLVRLTEDILTRSKLDISTNDLLVGDIVIALNFTRRRVSIVSSNGIPKSYAPLLNKSIPESDGKLILLTVKTLNSVKDINDTYGDSNYLKTIRDKLSTKGDPKSKDLLALYEFVIKCYDSGRLRNPIAESATFKVACMTVIDLDEHLPSKDHDTLCVNTLNLEISFDHPVSMKPHDSLNEGFALNKEIVETIRSHGHSCFIVDNHNAVSSRYINFADKVRLIPSIKANDRLDGFYMLSVDAKQTLNMDDFTPLENIDSVKYIYRTIEEAESGADLKQKYQRELDILKLNESQDSVRLKAEHDRLMRESDHSFKTTVANLEFEHKQRLQELDADQRTRISEMENMRLDMEKVAASRKLEYEEAMHKLKLESEARKHETEKDKHQFDTNRFRMDNESLYVKRGYEESKFERDSFIETVKTVGAVVGLMAGTYAVYSKFSK